MSGIYYLFSIVAVFIVIWWFIRNDKKSPNESTTGLLAMRSSENPDKSSPQSPKSSIHETAVQPPNEK